MSFVSVVVQLGGRIPVLDALSDLVSRARAIPVQLSPLSRLEGLVSEVQSWRESAAETFLLKSSPYSLLEVLRCAQSLQLCVCSSPSAGFESD